MYFCYKYSLPLAIFFTYGTCNFNPLSFLSYLILYIYINDTLVDLEKCMLFFIISMKYLKKKTHFNKIKYVFESIVTNPVTARGHNHVMNTIDIHVHMCIFHCF